MRKLLICVTQLFLVASLLIVSSAAQELPSSSIIANAGIISYTPLETATSLPRLEVFGNRIQYTNETQVWLRGVNYALSHWLYSNNGCPGGSSQYQRMAEWGCNAVRITCPSWETNSFSSYAQKLDNQIEWAAQNGMYSIIDCHPGYPTDVSGWTSTDWNSWRNWWSEVATRYVGNTNVLYDLLNEPYGLSSPKHQIEFQACVDVIRAIDTDVLLILEAITEDSWYDVALNWAQTHPISGSNLAYQVHVYYQNSDKPTSKASILRELTDYGCRWLLDNGKCVMTGEFNYDLDDCPVEGRMWFSNYMEVMDEEGYSGFLAWWWNSQSWTRLLRDWNGNPSDSGSILLEYLTG